MTSIVIPSDPGFVAPKPRPLWPKSGVVRGLRMSPGMRIEHWSKYDFREGCSMDYVMIALADEWSATGIAKSFVAARRIAVDRVKDELARRDG